MSVRYIVPPLYGKAKERQGGEDAVLLSTCSRLPLAGKKYAPRPRREAQEVGKAVGVVLHNCIALGMEIGQLEKQKSEDSNEIYMVPGVKYSHDPCVRPSWRFRTSVLLKSLFKTHRGFYICPRKVKYSAMGHSFTFCWRFFEIYTNSGLASIT